MTDDPISDYTREWVETYKKVRSAMPVEASFSDRMMPLAIAITKSIVSPYYYWYEEHDSEYLEGKDPEFIPAHSYQPAAGKASSAPPSPQTESPPHQDKPDTVKVTVKGQKTYSVKDDLKTKWNLRWNPDNSAWEGRIPKNEIINLMRFCDETGGIEVYEG